MIADGGTDGSRAYGHFDGMRGRVVSGWAWVPAVPKHQVGIRIFIDGVIAVAGLAGVFRSDLEAAGIADGRKSFNLLLPLQFCDGAEHEVAAVAEDGTVLLGCPCRLVLPDLHFRPIPFDPEPLPIELAICCIAKNEARYLLEWIAYHRVVGVEHFLVFDNESDDGTTEILNALAAKGIVEHVPWVVVKNGGSPRLSAYADSLRRLRDRAKWTAFIDLDEFLLPRDSDDVKVVLRNFDDAAGLVVPCRIFGSSGDATSHDELVLRRFTRPLPDQYNLDQTVKSIVRVRHVREMGAHTPVLDQGSLVDEHGKIVGEFGLPDHHPVPDASRLIINRYIGKSQGTGLGVGSDRELAGYNPNEEEHLGILRFEGIVREMRAALLQIVNDGTVPDIYNHWVQE
jgi:glycosyltransferase involved in cell wall biosynthesis